jgi:hypothetical protein
VRLLLALLAVLLAGCGVPQELAKQAEEVESIAAEGALLAHDAGEGSTTAIFTRVHARALRKLVRDVQPAIEHAELRALAEEVSRSLEQLAGDPRDRTRARRLEGRLEEAAQAAGELSG